MHIRTPILVSGRTIFVIISLGVVVGLIALLVILSASRRNTEEASSADVSALGSLAGQYAASQSECDLEPKFEVSANHFRTHTDGFSWPSLEYEETGRFSVARSDPTAPSAEKELIMGASSQPDGTTVISIFMPLTDADMEWMGLGAEQNKSDSQAPVIAYAAYVTDGPVDLSRVQPVIENAEDMALLITCVP